MRRFLPILLLTSLVWSQAQRISTDTPKLNVLHYAGATAGARIHSCLTETGTNLAPYCDASGEMNSPVANADPFAGALAGRTLEMPLTTMTFHADATCPAGLLLQMGPGAVMNAAPGKTLTINCGLMADDSVHFSGPGTIVFGAPNVRVKAAWFAGPDPGARILAARNAIGSGVVDAATFAGSWNWGTQVPSKKNVKIELAAGATITPTIPCPVKLTNGSDNFALIGAGSANTQFNSAPGGYHICPESGTAVMNRVRIEGIEFLVSPPALGAIKVGDPATAYAERLHRMRWVIRDVAVSWDGPPQAGSTALSLSELALSEISNVIVTSEHGTGWFDVGLLLDRTTVNFIQGNRWQAAVYPVKITSGDLVNGTSQDFLSDNDIGLCGNGAVGILADDGTILVRGAFIEATQTLAPSKATPTGFVPTVKVFSTVPSLARTLLTLAPLKLATHILAPS